MAEDKKTAATTLTLTARSIEMGILLDGNWNSNGATITSTANSTSLVTTGSGNIVLYAPVEGAYTFTYTLETKTLVVTFPNGTTLPLVKFFGSWDSWATGVVFSTTEDNLTATAKLSLTTGNYTFKITKDAAWLTNSGTMTRDNCTGWTFESGTSDATLTADADGEYTFTWTFEGDKLSVTFPAATTTDLTNINMDVPTRKLIRNGQVLIIREGATYNMMRQTVQQ